MSLMALHSRIEVFGSELGRIVRSLHAALTDPYRPELHYMRGPGPRWRERHVVVVGALETRLSRSGS